MISITAYINRIDVCDLFQCIQYDVYCHLILYKKIVTSKRDTYFRIMQPTTSILVRNVLKNNQWWSLREQVSKRKWDYKSDLS